MNWRPVTTPQVTSLDDLCEAWAVVMTALQQRPVEAAEVRLAMRAPAPLDSGVEPAVKAWKRPPPPRRFAPPGIVRGQATEHDIRMWLKVGAILEGHDVR